jgi:hypothetical protein
MCVITLACSFLLPRRVAAPPAPPAAKTTAPLEPAPAKAG